MTQAINTPFMKLNLFSRIAFAVVLAGFLVACSATSADEDKKARLEKLKEQQAAISKEILKLENEIAEENPDSVSTVRAKDVAVQELALQSFDHYVQTQGHIESENNVLVSAESPGVPRAAGVDARSR